MGGRIVRSLVFPIDSLAPRLRWLLGGFRLIVNRSIRTALREDIRSRYRLSSVAYQALSADHDLYKQYMPSAFEVAMGVLKNYRRRLRQRKKTGVPYLGRLLLKAENQSYRLDRTSGRLRIPIRRGEHVDIELPSSEWHRSILSDPFWVSGP